MKTVIYALMFIGCVAAGCTGVQRIGKVGDTEFYNVHAANLDGPNVTTIVALRNGETSLVQSYGGPGMLTEVAPAAVIAGGNVWAAGVLRPAKTSVEGGSATGGNAGGATATGGSAAASSTSLVDQSKRTDSHNVIIDSYDPTDRSIHEVNQNVTVP